MGHWLDCPLFCPLPAIINLLSEKQTWCCLVFIFNPPILSYVSIFISLNLPFPVTLHPVPGTPCWLLPKGAQTIFWGVGHWARSSSIQLDWLINEFQSCLSLPSAPQACGKDNCTWFYVRSGPSNSHPYVCIAGTLLTEHPAAPLLALFDFILCGASD